MTTADSRIVAKYNSLKARNATRDATMQMVAAVRRGDWNEAFPGKFSGEWPKPVIANLIDVAARDIAEMLAPLPAFNCSSPNMADETQRKAAERRSKIANHYVSCSRLQKQMYSGCDRFATYGFLPFLVELDMETQTPRIVLDDPMGAYYEKDRKNNVTTYMRLINKTVGELCAEFPDFAEAIQYETVSGSWGSGPSQRRREDSSKMEVVYFSDAKQTVLFIPDCANLVVRRYANPAGRCLVVVAERHSPDGNVRGQFDDVLWPQLARAKFSALSLEAATKAVEAPLAVPMDMQELALGPDAIMRSNTPEKIRRVPIEMPASAFSQDQVLDRESRIGARYPESRTGNIDASVVTGQGVKALNVGYDGQLKGYQSEMADALTQVIGLCFEVDEMMWPDVEKTYTGNDKGSPYELKYKAGKHIKGNHSVDVQYGLMAGLDPNRALVFGLQARSDDLISRDTLQRQLPFDINVDNENKLIAMEHLRDSLQQMVAGTAQAIPMMAQAGQDPLTAINQIAHVITAVGKGETIEDAIVAAFQPPPPEEPPPGEQPLEPGATPGSPGSEAASGGGIPGVQPSGLLNGVAAGQAGLPPGGRPDMQQLLAGLTQGGQPNLQANVAKRVPI